MDIEMPRGHFYGKRLAKAVQCGDVAEDTINTSVRRILRKKLHWLSQLNTAKATTRHHCLSATQAISARIGRTICCTAAK
jgi:beta-glucosidase-like glycosyl hydrolase